MLHIKFDQDWPTGFRDIQVQKCEIFIIQGQVTPKWVVWFGPKSNSTKLLCLSWLPATLMMIWSKMNELAWRHYFPIISGCWHVKGKHNYLWIIIFLFIKHWLESTPITYLSEPQDKWQLYIRKCTLVVMGYYGRWLDIQLPRWTSWRSKSWSAARTGYI